MNCLNRRLRQAQATVLLYTQSKFAPSWLLLMATVSNQGPLIGSIVHRQGQVDFAAQGIIAVYFALMKCDDRLRKVKINGS